MKHLFLFAAACCIVMTGFAQLKPAILQKSNNVSRPYDTYQHDGTLVGAQQTFSMVSSKSTLEDANIGWSYYDLQTNSSCQPRIYRHADGTIGAIYTMSHEASTSYTDRGAGYNYYDGGAWGPQPSARIEGDRAGWPNYAPLGAAGEIVISHRGAVHPLYVNTRATKGAGSWTELILQAPDLASGMDWPRMVTNGPDNMYVHLIAVTGPTGNGGVVWNDLDGALIYNRSLDGGVTWDGWQQLDGMTSAEYLSFGGDTYSFAEPVGNTLCFTVGDSWMDQFIMKSTDNGDTWTKTIVWDCPWDLWTGPDTTGIFYCADGANAVQLDASGKAHVVFGLQRGKGDENGDKFYYPWTDGLIYWNEDMPELPQDLDPDELLANGNYIGWVQDTMVWYSAITELAYYYGSLSSMPSMVTDADGNVFVMWSGVTILRDNDDYMLRHIYARASIDNGATWRDTIVDITGNFLYTWSECAYPSASPTSDNMLYVIFQEDTDAGVFLKSTNTGYQGQMSQTTNNFLILTPDKNDIIVPGVGINDRQEVKFQLSQNYPNPVKEQTTMKLTLVQAADVTVNVYSILGQNVQEISSGMLHAGNHQLVVDASGLNQGVYFISVKVGDQVQTRKMIVE